MKLEIFDKYQRLRLDIIRKFDFVQYVDEFNGIGSFRITIPYTEESMQYVVKDNYILFDDGIMGIIKYRFRKTSDSTSWEIKGYLLNKLADYRCFENTKKYNGPASEVSREIIDDFFISNSDSRRNIEGIVLSDDLEYIPESPIVSIQNTGSTVSTVLSDMLKTIGYGWLFYPQVVAYNESLDKPTNISGFEFRVRKPVDRTIGNNEGNVPVVFSMDQDNVSEFTFKEDDTLFCSVAIVAGEGTGQERALIEAGDTASSGIDRIELYIDARDVQSEDENGNVMSDDEYNSILQQRGLERLKEHMCFVSYNGNIISGGVSYTYGIDFNNGDYVSVVDKQSNIQLNVQITSVTKSETPDGEKLDVKFGDERVTVQQLIRKRGVS